MSETQAIPADTLEASWVAHAPSALQPYLRLARLDRPIGTWLLYWPCVFGLTLGAGALHRGILTQAYDWWLLILFGTGSVVMRGAGCTYNDIVDRDIDARVARTRGRPIPSGAVSVRQAWLFAALQCAIGLVILLCLHWFAVALGALSLLLIAAYPYMKRVTWLPQAWLGLTFNWGALLGFAAQTGRTSAAGLVLYTGCFFWTLGYDTIYALQDVEDDALAGVKSTARLFNKHSRTWIFLFYLMSFALLAAAAGYGFRSWIPVALLIPAGGHLLLQVRRLEIDKPEVCLRLFRANRETGAMIAAAFVIGSWFA